MTTKMVRRKNATHVTFVASDSRDDVNYQIARLPDGSMACACASWAFNTDRPKSCKHLDAHRYRASLSGRRRQATVIVRSEPEALPAAVTYQGETFTFRAIALDGLR
jgi:hypothetical protein